MICSGQKNRKESDIKTTSVIVPLIGDADSSFRKRGIQTEIQKQMKGYGETEWEIKKKIILRESKCVKENRKRNGWGHLRVNKQAKNKQIKRKNAILLQK
jgi:hypothetical protein